jgi:hypothetical protein
MLGQCAPLKVSGSILCGANFGELGRCKIGACLVFLSSCHYFSFSPVFRICHLKKKGYKSTFFCFLLVCVCESSGKIVYLSIIVGCELFMFGYASRNFDLV